MRKPQESIKQSVHWIIVNYKRHSIWLYPFLSLADAKSEFDYQISKLKAGYTHNFKIEQRGFIDYSNSSRNVREDDDFEDFKDVDKVTQSALDNF